jgi:hypothetical protein
MKKFFLALLDSTNPLNSKVFAGMVCLFLIIIMTVASFFITISLEVFYAVTALCTASLGLSAISFKNGNDGSK